MPTPKAPVAIADSNFDTRGKWLALAAALLGWLFDGAEMGIFSMVGHSSLHDLLPTSAGEAEVSRWFGVIIAMFLVGAATGGVLFGWLGDRLGRVRAMTLSVVVYALFTGLCGLATSPLQLAVLRFVAALGMGGEWSLGVALVMEIWPNRSRALMAGLIGAAANVGYLLVGVVGLALDRFLKELHVWLIQTGMRQQTTDWLLAHEGWRLIMILGAAPALLTFFIRIFVPESKRWTQERGRGMTSFWATRDLVGVLIGALGASLIVLVCAKEVSPWIRLSGILLGLAVAIAGFTYPVLQFLRREQASAGISTRGTLQRMLVAAALSGVALLGTWGSTQWAPGWADQIASKAHANDTAKVRGSAQLTSKSWTQMSLAVGAVLGTIVAAFMGDWVGRRPAYCALCALSIASILMLYQGSTEFGASFLTRAFFCGACTAAFYGWLPLYLPELFPTRLRATGQGFAFNFGRVLAAVGALQNGAIMDQFKHNVRLADIWPNALPTTLAGYEIQGGFPLACTVMSSIYIVGMVLIWLVPETRGRPLPD